MRPRRFLAPCREDWRHTDVEDEWQTSTATEEYQTKRFRYWTAARKTHEWSGILEELEDAEPGGLLPTRANDRG